MDYCLKLNSTKNCNSVVKTYFIMGYSIINTYFIIIITYFIIGNYFIVRTYYFIIKT